MDWAVLYYCRPVCLRTVPKKTDRELLDDIWKFLLGNFSSVKINKIADGALQLKLLPFAHVSCTHSERAGLAL